MNTHQRFIEIRSKYLEPQGGSLGLFHYWVQDSYCQSTKDFLINTAIEYLDSYSEALQRSAIQTFGAAARLNQVHVIKEHRIFEQDKFKLEILASINMIELRHKTETELYELLIKAKQQTDHNSIFQSIIAHIEEYKKENCIEEVGFNQRKRISFS